MGGPNTVVPKFAYISPPPSAISAINLSSGQQKIFTQVTEAWTCLFFLTLVGVEEGVGSSPPPRPTQFSLLSPRKSIK